MRRFVTRADVDAAVDAGLSVLHVGPRDTVTDVAREHAQQRGLRIERAERAPGDELGAGGSVAAGGAAGAGRSRDAGGGAGETGSRAPLREDDPERLRRKVRHAVIAELGETPAGLDQVIDRVLRSREG